MIRVKIWRLCKEPGPVFDGCVWRCPDCGVHSIGPEPHNRHAGVKEWVDWKDAERLAHEESAREGRKRDA